MDDLDKPGDPHAPLAVAVATELLIQLTAGLFPGIHQVTELYDTRTSMAADAALYPITLRGIDYRTINRGCECGSCGVMHRIRLRGQPVRHILSVVVNGQPLQPTEYVLLDHSVLGFLTSAACCAGCVTVQYEYGAPPPSAGRLAALKLANELVEALDPGGSCALPARVTSVSRQGVSWTLLDNQDFLENGRTGIYEVDLFLKTYNPAGALRPARVYSVDRPRVSTTTYEYPPLALTLQPNDLAVVVGSAAGWAISDSYAVDVLTSISAGVPTATPLLSLYGGAIEYEPTLYRLPTDQQVIILTIDYVTTRTMRQGTPWVLYGVLSNGAREPLLSGEVRTL